MLDIIQRFNQLQREEDAVRKEHQAAIDKAGEKVKAAELRTERARARVEKLEKRRNKLPSTYWVDGIVEPLAKTLAERAGLYWKIYGPFGLSCQTTIYLMAEADVSITKQKTRSITLEPYHDENGDWVIRYRTGETTDEYEKGTLGHMNGMNCVTAPLPDTIEEIEKLLRESEASE